MKNVAHRVRAQLAALALTLAALPGLAWAEGADAVLTGLHKLRIENYLALNAFYNYVTSGDRMSVDDINTALQTSSSQLNDIRSNAGTLLNEDTQKNLSSTYETFSKLMKTNISDVTKQGYPELQLVSEMANAARDLVKMSEDIHDAVESGNTSAKKSETLSATRDASLTLAMMLANYSARSNLAASQTVQGSDSEEPLDVLAARFEKALATLEQAGLTGEQAKHLKEVQSKWAFIRGSYINFNENNVVFVINRYSLIIIEHLEALLDELTAA